MLAPRSAEAQLCTTGPIDLTLCPDNMPAPEDLDHILLFGSASGTGYYDDCNFIAQLEACGWPAEKIHPIYRSADFECIADGALVFDNEIQLIRQATGVEKFDLFGYSIGGPRAWAWLTLLEGWKHVKEVVFWASPNYGLTYTPALLPGVALDWHKDITEISDFNACVWGTGSVADPCSTTPNFLQNFPTVCNNPFRDFPPMAKSRLESWDGITYYNIFSDDLPCAQADGGFCRCVSGTWCDGPQSVHTQSDAVIVGENSRMPGVYNIDVEFLYHWDFIVQLPDTYFTKSLWDAAHGAIRTRNEVWAQTMLGFLGRAPSAYLEDDGDGVDEEVDNCPFVANAGQEDADGDEIGDACDDCPGEAGRDFDSDGLCASADNCPYVPNLDQADGDSDGIGDACDPCPGFPGGDADGDGYFACADDCDDTNPDVHPGATEVCNGIDDNCDTVTDEGFDGDNDTWTSCAGDCDDADPDVNPGALELCNGVDDDCDTEIDEDYAGVGGACTAGVGACEAAGALVCATDGSGTECDAVPGDPVGELCNSLDDDCDTQVDEDFPDLGLPCTDGVGACEAAGFYVCTVDGLMTECDAVAGTPTTETCNGIDDDCDALTLDEPDGDGDGESYCTDCDDTDGSNS
ncbi:MAG: thrombospondin type 3 repeat-containing protein, partial [Myxococcales bacterium]|nr:thrombospondin type 3 repeat-containing protein [Myxococcales bacterium]